MRKIKFFIDDEKEERWINGMCAQGWHLKKFATCFYTFEKGEPGQYIYRNEMLKEFVLTPQARDYLAFVEETGAEFVHRSGYWVYFRQKAAKGNFELYSDGVSKLAYLQRMRNAFLIVFILNVFAVLLNFNLFLTGNHASINGFTALFNIVICILLGIALAKIFERKKKVEEQSQILE